VATSEGPVSMCRHNAVRDAELLKPLPMSIGFWNPLTGALEPRPPRLLVQHSAKTAKGRVRERIIGNQRNAERGDLKWLRSHRRQKQSSP